MELVATPGGTTSNSYVTLADATTMLLMRLHTEPWFSPTTPVAQSATLGPFQVEPSYTPSQTDLRSAALIWATQLLDEQVQWFGQPLTLTQALAWPMTGQTDVSGRALPSTTVPTVIQRATAYYALALLRDRSESVETLAGQQLVHSLKLGATTVVYQSPSSVPASAPTRGLPAEIRQMLRSYGTMTSSVMVPLRRT
jgi:hypothetical protein